MGRGRGLRTDAVAGWVQRAGKALWVRLTVPADTRRTAIRQERARHIMTWVLWSPPRFFSVVGGALLVVMILGLVYTGRTVEGFQMAKYERDVAAQAAEIGKAAVDSGMDAAAEGAVEGTLPVSPPSLPSVTATPSVAAPTQPSSADPESVTRAMLTAWAGGPRAKSDAAWVESMSRYVTPELAGLFKMTDRSQIPAGVKVGPITSVQFAEEARATADLGPSFGSLTATLVSDEKGRWRVSELAPSDAEGGAHG